MKKIILTMTLLVSLNAMAKDLVCFGTEPFFSVGITSDSIGFDLFGEGETNETIQSVNEAIGTSDYAYTIKSQSLRASVITGACNDGMSDNVYPKHILIETDKGTFYGCCRSPQEAKW